VDGTGILLNALEALLQIWPSCKSIQVGSNIGSNMSRYFSDLPESIDNPSDFEEVDWDTLFKTTASPKETDFLKLPSKISLDVNPQHHSLAHTGDPQETKGVRKCALDKSKTPLEVSEVSSVRVNRSKFTQRLRCRMRSQTVLVESNQGILILDNRISICGHKQCSFVCDTCYKRFARTLRQFLCTVLPQCNPV